MKYTIAVIAITVLIDMQVVNACNDQELRTRYYRYDNNNLEHIIKLYFCDETLNLETLKIDFLYIRCIPINMQ